MTTHTTTAIDETTRFPEPVGDCDDLAEARQMGADAEDRAPEEAGYGYGV